MWRLLNKLFGWHYVRFNFKGKSIIKRVQGIKNNDAHISVSVKTNLCNIGYGYYLKNRPVGQELEQYIPLTFKPEELIK